jgi:hypothetical protein
MRDHDQELDRLRDRENRNQFALRRTERRLEVEEHALERRLDDLRETEERSAQALADGYRREHWGKAPPPRRD